MRWNKKGMLGNILGAFIIIIIGFMMLPEISKVLKEVNINNSNNASSTLLNLVPFVFGAMICFISGMMIYNSLRSAGLMGGNSNETIKDIPDDEGVIKPRRLRRHRQTYPEYVAERLRVERLLGRRINFRW